MKAALKERDQKLALAATEFWSGIVEVASFDLNLRQHVMKEICKKLPELLPLLLDCCIFTEYDK
jgi:hypothetical protein